MNSQYSARFSELDGLIRRRAADIKRMVAVLRFGSRATQRFTYAHGRPTIDDWEDLVQETFLRALSSEQRTRQSLANGGYLFIIARNLYIDGWRRRRPLHIELDENVVAASTFYPEDAHRERIEQLERLSRYVEELSPTLSRFYEARFVRGLSQRDTAREIGVSRRHVRTLENRLLASAARALQTST